MAFNHSTITQQEIDNNNLEGLPDIPGYSTVDMQRALDKLATMVATKLNDLITAMAQSGTGVPTINEMTAAINAAIVSIGAGDMAKAVYDPTNKVADIFAYADTQTATALGAAQNAQAAAQNAQATANTANTTANAALPKTGGTMTGWLSAIASNTANPAVRNILFWNASQTPVSRYLLVAQEE